MRGLLYQGSMRSALWLVALTAACAGDPEIRDGVVAPLRVPCTGEGSSLCISLEDSAGDEGPGLLYGGLSGYSHRWGVEAHVRYHAETIDDPPADGSSRRYVVDEVVAELEGAVGPEFDLAFPDVPPGNGWFSVGGVDRLDMAGTIVACAPAVCNDILARTDATVAFTVRFALVGPNSLRALRVD
jgi:hypothetical protein